jgi:hypothetical protein
MLEAKMRRLAALACLSIPLPALAAGGIEIGRGPDTVQFGSCVPSLTVENGSGETIDYLQVDLALLLTGGRERIVELKSAYREGVHYPIAPGGTALLKQHLDTEAALGAPCSAITARRVARTICEVAEGRPCAAPPSVSP